MMYSDIKASVSILILLIVAAGFWVLIVPLCVIFALNIIFNLGIEFTIWSWLAIIIIMYVIRRLFRVGK